MISSKFDEVKRNSVWREHLKKEAKEEFRSHDFSVNLGQSASAAPGGAVDMHMMAAEPNPRVAPLTRAPTTAPTSPRPVATISDKPTQFNPHDLVRMAAEFNEQGTTVQDLAGDMKLTGAAPAEAAEDGELPTCSSRTYGCVSLAPASPGTHC